MAVFDTKNLINAIYDEIVIWDTSLAASEDCKELAWHRIGNIFGITNVSKLKTKWASIRSCFARELRLEKEYLFSGSRKRKSAVYQYTKRLAFLRPHMRLKSGPRCYGSSGYHQAMKFEVDEPSALEDNHIDTMHESHSQQTADIAMFERCLTELSKEKAAEIEETQAHKKAKLAKHRSPTPDQPTHCGSMAPSSRTPTQTAGKIEKFEEDKNVTWSADADDTDWDFCKFIYHKIKAVPESEEKEDLLLSIHQMIVETRRKLRNRSATVVSETSASPRMACATLATNEAVNHRCAQVVTCSGSFQGRTSSCSSFHEMPQTNYALTNGVESYQLPSFDQSQLNPYLGGSSSRHTNGTNAASRITNTGYGQQATANSSTTPLADRTVPVADNMPVCQPTSNH